jgi:hypothetical protein
MNTWILMRGDMPSTGKLLKALLGECYPDPHYAAFVFTSGEYANVEHIAQPGTTIETVSDRQLADILGAAIASYPHLDHFVLNYNAGQKLYSARIFIKAVEEGRDPWCSPIA